MKSEHGFNGLCGTFHELIASKRQQMVGTCIIANCITLSGYFFRLLCSQRHLDVPGSLTEVISIFFNGDSKFYTLFVLEVLFLLERVPFSTLFISCVRPSSKFICKFAGYNKQQNIVVCSFSHVHVVPVWWSFVVRVGSKT